MKPGPTASSWNQQGEQLQANKKTTSTHLGPLDIELPATAPQIQAPKKPPQVGYQGIDKGMTVGSLEIKELKPPEEAHPSN